MTALLRSSSSGFVFLCLLPPPLWVFCGAMLERNVPVGPRSKRIFWSLSFAHNTRLFAKAPISTNRSSSCNMYGLCLCFQLVVVGNHPCTSHRLLRLPYAETHCFWFLAWCCCVMCGNLVNHSQVQARVDRKSGERNGDVHDFVVEIEDCRCAVLTLSVLYMMDFCIVCNMKCSFHRLLVGFKVA